MNPFSTSPAPTDEWVNIRGFIQYANHTKKILLIAICIGVILGVLYLRFTAPYYEVSMLVAPKQNSLLSGTEQGNSLGTLLLGKGHGNEKFEQFTEMLSSRVVAETLNTKENALQHIFADRWDKENKTWLAPTGFKASVQKLLRLAIGRPAWTAPSLNDLELYLKNNIVLETVTPKTLYEIKIRTNDPKTGYWLLNGVFNAAQSVFKEAEITKQQGRADYVLSVLQTATDINQRRSLTSILDSLQMQLVIANSKEPIAMDVLQRPSIPELPLGPRLGMTLVIGTVLGSFVGFALVLVGYLRQQQQV